MLEGKLIIIPALGHQNKGKSSFTASGLFVLMSQCGNNNELALQHGGFCTTWSLAAKGLLRSLTRDCLVRTWWLQRMATARFARLYDNTFALTFSSASVSFPSWSCSVMEALYVLKTLAVRPSISSDKYLFNDVVYIGQREFQRRDVNMNHDEIVFPIVTRKHTGNLRIVAKRTCNTSLPQKMFHIGHEIEKK